MEYYENDDEPLGPSYDEEEDYTEYEPVEFFRWSYDKTKLDEIDYELELAFDLYEEQRLSIGD